jgi:putative transposase
VSPSQRRAAVAFLMRKRHVSERRACQVVGLHRSTNRYAAVPTDFEARLVAAMKEFADRFPRYGYRRIHALLVADGWNVNVKRIERLWVLEGLQVPPRRLIRGQKAFGTSEFSAWALPALRPTHIWSYDFVSVRLANGSKFRVLNVVDEYTREALGSRVASSIGARDVTKHLSQLFEAHGRPAMIRSDNGREFVAETVKDWLRAQGVEPVFIRKASPQQNCYVERFNGTMRDELLDRELFRSLTEARVVINEWLVEYNTFRPHRGLGMKPPAVFAADALAKLKEAKREGVALVTNDTQTGPKAARQPAGGNRRKPH